MSQKYRKIRNDNQQRTEDDYLNNIEVIERIVRLDNSTATNEILTAITGILQKDMNHIVKLLKSLKAQGAPNITYPSGEPIAAIKEICRDYNTRAIHKDMAQLKILAVLRAAENGRLATDGM